MEVSAHVFVGLWVMAEELQECWNGPWSLWILPGPASSDVRL